MKIAEAVGEATVKPQYEYTKSDTVRFNLCLPRALYDAFRAHAPGNMSYKMRELIRRDIGIDEEGI